MSSRITRSRSRQPETDLQANPTQASTLPTLVPEPPHEPKLKSQGPSCRYLDEEDLNKRLKRLPKDDLALLRLKQRKLREPDSQVRLLVEQHLAGASIPLARATAATLVFAWEAAGTAVCISSVGLLLTCSHCVAEGEDDYDPEKLRWLLFASGDAVQAKCVAFDGRRDLAFLQIVTAPSSSTSFPYIPVFPKPPKLNTQLYCIGHPGSEDLEASHAGIATNYDVLHISEGRFRGLAKDQDPQDNSEIGALMHDCWTYWGHSGAPIVERKTGMLVGLHSSWDDETGMRRGVAWEAVGEFWEEWTER